MSDPLKSEAPPSSKKVPLKANWRKWQKYQLRLVTGKNEQITKNIDQLFVGAFLACRGRSSPAAAGAGLRTEWQCAPFDG